MHPEDMTTEDLELFMNRLISFFGDKHYAYFSFYKLGNIHIVDTLKEIKKKACETQIKHI